MKRFKFTLQSLLKMRNRREEQIKLELALKNQEIGQAKNEMALLHTELSLLQNSQKSSRASALNITSLRHSVAFRHKLKKDMLTKGQQIGTLNEHAAQIRSRLTEARRQTRSVELVKEHRFADWRKSYRTREQGFIDDLSQQAYIRRGDAAPV